jgi:hypothetical protein
MNSPGVDTKWILNETSERLTLFSRGATALQSKAFINRNGHVVLRVIEGEDNFNSIQAGIAHETNGALRHFEVEGVLGVISPIRNTLIVNPRLGISQKRFHKQNNQDTPKTNVMTLSKDVLPLSGVRTHYRTIVDPKIHSEIQKRHFEFSGNVAATLIAPNGIYHILIVILCNSVL